MRKKKWSDRIVAYEFSGRVADVYCAIKLTISPGLIMLCFSVNLATASSLELKNSTEVK